MTKPGYCFVCQATREAPKVCSAACLDHRTTEEDQS